MFKTSFLLPTAREQWIDCIQSWHNPDDEFLVGLNAGSTLANLNRWDNVKFFYYDVEKGDVVSITNGLAKEATGDVLFYLGDDVRNLTQDWKRYIVFSIPALYYPDDRGEEMATFPIITRSLYEALGWFYRPVFKSMYCDTDLHEIAKELGVLKFIPEFKVQHFHPTKNTAPNDAIYKISRRNMKSGKAIYENESSRKEEIVRIRRKLDALLSI